MKKILTVLLFTALMVCFSGCGNKDLFDTVYTYDTAIIKMPDGSTREIEIDQWTDYEGEQIQIIAKDGTVYLVNSVNCVLIRNAK
ncbi:MAG: hypothetical protein PHD46_05525 [Eubacteriales bacterium]|nr:hypothetical protein [Eubacteriales bacterium]MDD4422478.1 hypothetical protein [Eubacteriales bacterium]